MKSLLLAVTALVAVWAAPAPEHLTGQALVDFVNANTNLWKAQLNTKWTLPQFKKRLMNSKYVKVPAGTPEVHHEVQNLASIPASFDGRDQWGATCPSVKWIRDQSDCGSCWAFAAAEIASDRTCINNPNIPIMLSAEDILACCGFSCGDGCEGGYPIEAMKWWVSKGVVTGTSYLDHQGCKPYSIAPCGHHNDTYYKECPSDIYPTPKCTLTCQTGYPTPYPQDKHFAKSAYKVSRTVSSIQTEIMTYGPVEAAFTVYEDFYNYKSGVYHHVTGQELGGHAVKILGWGVESSVKYWLVANSWDTDWGESGYFRIRQGNDECGIEDGIVAGLPKS